MMIRNTAAAAAAFLTLAIAGQAAAAEQVVTAKLEQPVAERTKLVAGGAVFWCEGAECIANTTNSRTFITATCKDLAGKFGAIAAFEDGRKSFDAERLSACNAAALPKTQVANR
ncbi:hypothetical protein [Phenylobacterium sp.]|uniref:CC_3452 family protein n=1 Tax=Phenylobacterium sp. TaxID=1871053 RepID=UPI0026349FF5|nr:hypothetical protein [Phenylobacterium sp.]